MEMWNLPILSYAAQIWSLSLTFLERSTTECASHYFFLPWFHKKQEGILVDQRKDDALKKEKEALPHNGAIQAQYNFKKIE